MDATRNRQSSSPSCDRNPSYGTLYENFRAALAAAQWDDAEHIRQEMAISNLTTADNLLFLEVEQYAQQGRWREISSHKDFSLLTRMQIPRAVRAALLTAFHQTYLLASEQQQEWQQAFDSFQENQPQLGQSPSLLDLALRKILSYKSTLIKLYLNVTIPL